jgi:lysophospholipase L1-like esterase
MYYIRRFALFALPASLCLGVMANLVANIPPLQVGGDIRRIERDSASSGSPPSICPGGSCMAVQGGVKLRILGVGDSITVGYGPGTDGNGYRKRLQENLAGE